MFLVCLRTFHYSMPSSWLGHFFFCINIFEHHRFAFLHRHCVLGSTTRLVRIPHNGIDSENWKWNSPVEKEAFESRIGGLCSALSLFGLHDDAAAAVADIVAPRDLGKRRYGIDDMMHTHRSRIEAFLYSQILFLHPLCCVFSRQCKLMEYIEFHVYRNNTRTNLHCEMRVWDEIVKRHQTHVWRRRVAERRKEYEIESKIGSIDGEEWNAILLPGENSSEKQT